MASTCRARSSGRTSMRRRRRTVRGAGSGSACHASGSSVRSRRGAAGLSVIGGAPLDSTICMSVPPAPARAQVDAWARTLAGDARHEPGALHRVARDERRHRQVVEEQVQEIGGAARVRERAGGGRPEPGADRSPEQLRERGLRGLGVDRGELERRTARSTQDRAARDDAGRTVGSGLEVAGVRDDLHRSARALDAHHVDAARPAHRSRRTVGCTRRRLLRPDALGPGDDPFRPARGHEGMLVT